MKRLLLAALLAAIPLAATAADTAYTALRLVGKKNGEETLGRVVEVRGRFGSPEPSTWKVVVGERGGVREYDVQRGKISGEKAPNSRGGGSGAPLDLNKLNIDSEGAFTIVNKEMQKSGVPFDRVDYVLNSAGRAGVPTWHLEMYDGRNGRVSSIEISADTGEIVGRNMQADRRNPAADDHAYVRERPVPPPEPVHRRDTYADDRRADDRRVYDDDRRVSDDQYPDERRAPSDRRVSADDEAEGPGITDLFGKIGRHFERRGSQIKNFFTR